MFKNYSKFCIVIVFYFAILVSTALAIDLDEATRTVVQDSTGSTVILTPEQVKRGIYILISLIL